jgi:hypothetical protein
MTLVERTSMKVRKLNRRGRREEKEVHFQEKKPTKITKDVKEDQVEF